MSQRRQTALAMVEAYNKWDLPAIMALRDPSCVTDVGPKSLDRPTMNNQEYETWFGPMMANFQNFHVTVHEVFEDEGDNKLVMRASSTADSVVGPYANEYILFLWFTEGGDKIVRFLEFVDSSVSFDFLARLKAHSEGKKE